MTVIMPTSYAFLGQWGARYFALGQDVKADPVEDEAENTHWLFNEAARRKPSRVFWGTDTAARTPAGPAQAVGTSLATAFHFALSLPPGRKRLAYWVHYQNGQVELGRRTLGSTGAWTTTTLALTTTLTEATGTWSLTAGARYEIRVRWRDYDGVTPVSLYGLSLDEDDALVADLPT